MSNVVVASIAWLALAIHLAVGLLQWRHPERAAALPFLSLATGVCILAYWIPRWYSYVARGVRWYASDQVVPLYGLALCLLAGITITYSGRLMVAHRVILWADAAVLLLAALFLTFFRMRRLI